MVVGDDHHVVACGLTRRDLVGEEATVLAGAVQILNRPALEDDDRLLARSESPKGGFRRDRVPGATIAAEDRRAVDPLIRATCNRQRPAELAGRVERAGSRLAGGVVAVRSLLGD